MTTHEVHTCLACRERHPVVWKVVDVRPIYWGVVYKRVCPKGHTVVEHRRA